MNDQSSIQLVVDPLAQRPLFGFEEYESPLLRQQAIINAILIEINNNSYFDDNLFEELAEKLLLTTEEFAKSYEKLSFSIYSVIKGVLQNQKVELSEDILTIVSEKMNIPLAIVRMLNKNYRLKILSEATYKGIGEGEKDNEQDFHIELTEDETQQIVAYQKEILVRLAAKKVDSDLAEQ